MNEPVQMCFSKEELHSKFILFMQTTYPERDDDDEQKEKFYTRIGLFYHFVTDLFDDNINE